MCLYYLELCLLENVDVFIRRDSDLTIPLAIRQNHEEVMKISREVIKVVLPHINTTF